MYPKTTQKIVPGPGAHEFTEAINQTGRYSLSNHRSSKSKTFNPPRSKRFNKSTTDVPGAGTYHPKNDLPEDGNYVLSTNKSSRKRAFLMGNRGSFVEEMPKRIQSKHISMQHPALELTAYLQILANMIINFELPKVQWISEHRQPGDDLHFCFAAAIIANLSFHLNSILL